MGSSFKKHTHTLFQVMTRFTLQPSSISVKGSAEGSRSRSGRAGGENRSNTRGFGGGSVAVGDVPHRRWLSHVSSMPLLSRLALGLQQHAEHVRRLHAQQQRTETQKGEELKNVARAEAVVVQLSCQMDT